MQRFAFGLDISDRSAELVSLLSLKGRVAIDRYGRIELPPGIIDRGVINDQDKLESLLSTFLDEFIGPKRAIVPVGVSLQENLIYSKVFSLPAALDESMAEKAMHLAAGERLPLPFGDLAAASLPLGHDEKQQDWLFSATSHSVLESYRQVLQRVRLKPLFFDTEALALGRAIADRKEAGAQLLVDIGARTTAIDVWDRGGIRFSSAVPLAGDQLTSAIEIQRNIPMEQAEQMKNQEGFDPAAGDGRTFLILQRPMSDIIEEIRRTISFYERTTGHKIRKVILAGGTCLVPHLGEYLTSNLHGLPVSRGNPLSGISVDNLHNIDKFTKISIIYATAIGLALRAMGVREGPGVDLALDKSAGNGTGLISGLRTAAASLIAMVTHKKTHHKKKGAADSGEPLKSTSAVSSEPPAVEPEAAASPAVDQILPSDDELASSRPVSVSHDYVGAAEEPVAEEKETEPEPQSEQQPAAEAAAPKSKPEQTADYGRGIGDILGSAYTIEGQEDEENEEPGTEIRPTKPSRERLAIESILTKAKKGGSILEERAGRGRSFVLTAVLAVLVLIFLAIAVFGIIMFIRKNGLPKIPQFQKAPAAQAPAQQPAKTGAPASVSLLAHLALDRNTAGDKVFLQGRAIETDASLEDTFQTSGQAAASPNAKAKGIITIVNTTSKSYTFVATTRFLTKDNVLFRMDKATVIPANGSVQTAVTADKPGPSGDIGPTEFTIPGLSQNLQPLIYGKSESAMTGGSSTAKAIAAVDLTAAKAKLTERLSAEGMKNFSAMLATGEKIMPELITSSELSFDAPKAGTVGASFVAKLTLRFRTLVIPERDVMTALQGKLSAALPSGQSAADYTLAQPQYVIEAYESAKDQAEIRVEAAVQK